MKKGYGMLPEQIAIYVIAVVVATVVFFVMTTRHVQINLVILLQALPAILAAIAAINRAMASTPASQETASKIIDLADRTRAAADATPPSVPPNPPAASAQ